MSDKRARGGDAVFQREAGAGRRLRAVAEHPPVAVRAAAELEGAEMQEMAAGRLARRPAAADIPGCEAISAGRQEPFGDQPVVAVDVGDDRFEQLGALDQAGGDRLPIRVSSISTGTCASGQARSVAPASS